MDTEDAELSSLLQADPETKSKDEQFFDAFIAAAHQYKADQHAVEAHKAQLRAHTDAVLAGGLKTMLTYFLANLTGDAVSAAAEADAVIQSLREKFSQ